MKKPIVFAVLLLTIVISSCKGSDKSEKVNIIRKQDKAEQNAAVEKIDPNKVVAKVNGKEILQKDLKRKTLDAVIADEILYIEAQNLGIDKKIDHKLPEGKKIIGINAMKTLFQSTYFKKTEPTQEEIENYYKEISDRYKYVGLVIINISGTEKEAIKVKKDVDKLKNPDKLESLEAKYADTKTRVVVNETSSTRFRDYSDYIKPEKGYISDLIENKKNKYEVLFVKDVSELGTDRLRSQIRHKIISIQKAESFKKYVEELKEKNKVNVEIL
ncbi:MAG: hypothetical protein ACRENO_08425 [Thermodesulfobacteriota bacterium]